MMDSASVPITLWLAMKHSGVLGHVLGGSLLNIHGGFFLSIS